MKKVLITGVSVIDFIFQIDEIKDLFETAGLKVVDCFHDCGNEIFILSS